MQISLGIEKDDVVHFDTIPVSSMDHLAELICHSHYSLSTFANGYRNKANFLETAAIGLDFDEGVTLAEAEEAFARYTHIIAPTRSHGVEKNGKVQDRFRVVLFLAQPITDADTFEATWFSLAERWPWLDRKCKDASRFFYPSKYVHSIKADGVLVEPVVPPPREEKVVDLSTLLPGDRGRLSKETRQFLETGVESGGRNHATFKAAKDFQQNLYSFEETRDAILTALTSTCTIAADFTENEVENTIRSAFNSEPKHEPRIKERAFKLMSIGEMYEDKTEVEWLVDSLLMVGGMSLISADPKAGKSTISRQLVREVLRGGMFLGRHCKQGSVFYFGMEEHKQVLNKSFKRLGILQNEPLLVHVGDALNDEAFQDFRDILCERKPALAVVDTVFDLVEVESENNYGEIKRKLKKLRQVARDSGTHILCIHHNGKGNQQDGRRGNARILGSQAISGAMDAIMVIELEGKTRRITSSGREVRPWHQREIVFDWNDCTYSL